MEQNTKNLFGKSLQFPRRRISLNSLETLLVDSDKIFPKFKQPDLVQKYFRPFYKQYSTPTKFKIPFINHIERLSQQKVKQNPENKNTELKKNLMKAYIIQNVQKTLNEKKKILSNKKDLQSKKQFQQYKKLLQLDEINNNKQSGSQAQKKIDKYLKEKSIKKIKQVKSSQKKIPEKSRRQNDEVFKNMIFTKQRNNYDFLKKGSNVTKKILIEILKRKLLNPKMRRDNNDLAFNEEIIKQFNEIIPNSLQEIIGKGDMIRMVKIFKGIETNQIEITIPIIKTKQSESSHKTIKSNQSQEQKKLERINKITGWQSEEK